MSDANENMPSNMFATALAEISYGGLQEQASDMLQELIEAVSLTAKKGTLTLTLEIKPRGHDSGQVEVSGSVKINSPVPDIAPSMFFVKDGQLMRDNPNQMKLPFGDKAPKPVSKASNQ